MRDAGELLRLFHHSASRLGVAIFRLDSQKAMGRRPIELLGLRVSLFPQMVVTSPHYLPLVGQGAPARADLLLLLG